MKKSVVGQPFANVCIQIIGIYCYQSAMMSLKIWYHRPVASLQTFFYSTFLPNHFKLYFFYSISMNVLLSRPQWEFCKNFAHSNRRHRRNKWISTTFFASFFLVVFAINIKTRLFRLTFEYHLLWFVCYYTQYTMRPLKRNVSTHTVCVNLWNILLPLNE